MKPNDDQTVSVVIPCYNGEAFLRESLESALGQSYPDKEVIVVDDGSTDSSPRILEEYGNRIRVITQPNAGLPAARNAGIAISKGSLLAFLDADDYWETEFLSKMVAALKHSGADIAYCGWQNIGLPGGRGKAFIPPDYSQADKVQLLLRNARWPVHGAVSRKHVITDVGAFDPTLTSCADFDLWLRVAPFCAIVLVPEVLAYYRFHQGPQITKNHVRMALNVWMIQRRFIGEHRHTLAHLSDQHIAELTHGELLKKGYACYWQNDLASARAIFRIVMRTGYGTTRDWKYMLPSLLPLRVHRTLISLIERCRNPPHKTNADTKAESEGRRADLEAPPHLGAAIVPTRCSDGLVPCPASRARPNRLAIRSPMPPSDDDQTVSIVIPCYNGEAFLRESLESALGQSYPRKEVIVVDDGSTDSSPRILKEYGNRIRVITQPNAGLPAARNAGIAISKGSMLAFLDADDYWETEFLSKMVAALEHSGADIAYCGWQNVGLPGGRGKAFIPPDYSQVDKVELLLRNARWPVHGALSRKHVITDVGAFDPTLTSCEDFDLWLRVVPFCAIVLVPEVLAYYRFHQGPQVTKNHVRMARNLWMIQRRFIRKHRHALAHLSDQHIAELTHGELLKKGYACYWQRDVEAARAIFRLVMRTGYGIPRDWKYMLPSLLPLRVHRMLISLIERCRNPTQKTNADTVAVTEGRRADLEARPRFSAGIVPSRCSDGLVPYPGSRAHSDRCDTTSSISQSYSVDRQQDETNVAARVPVLMYHRVGEINQRGEKRYAISPEGFSSHMRCLSSEGYHAVGIDALVTWLEGGPSLPNKSFVITFDDGFSGVRDHALPVLEELKWPCSIFLVSDLIGKQASWGSHSSPSGKTYPLLSKEEILDMQKRGVSFQSHTRSHASLPTLDNSQLADQLVGSRVNLTELLGHEVRYLAYPHGHFDARVEAAARAAGYSAAFSTQSGFNRPGGDLFRIRRLDVYGSDTPVTLMRKIKLGTNDGGLLALIGYYVRQTASHFTMRG